MRSLAHLALTIVVALSLIRLGVGMQVTSDPGLKSLVVVCLGPDLVSFHLLPESLLQLGLVVPKALHSSHSHLSIVQLDVPLLLVVLLFLLFLLIHSVSPHIFSRLLSHLGSLDSLQSYLVHPFCVNFGFGSCSFTSRQVIVERL